MATADVSLGEHSLVHERTIEAIRDSGMLGTGFGTFEEAFRFYRTDDIQGDFGTSHFTYLANVPELGIPVAAALLCVFAFVLARAHRASRNGGDAVYHLQAFCDNLCRPRL